jgi:uncharacterized protein YfaP (DUF2135 family)
MKELESSQGALGEEGQFSRRTMLKRAGAAGVATAWAVPVVQTLGMSGAAAQGSPPPNTQTGTLTGQVTDASDASPIQGATVTVNSTGQSTTTDASGNYTIANVPAGSQSVTASATGYISATQSTTVPASGTATLNFALSPAPTGTGEIRAVLSWGATPSDLDLHVSGPVSGAPSSTRFHVYFGNPNVRDADNDPYCELDVDDTDGNGPETQTITISVDEGNYVAGDYHVWVHNFSGGSFAGSGATLNLFDKTTQRGSFAQDAVVGDDSRRIWKVANFTIDDAGNMTVVTPVQAMDDGNSGSVF